MTFMTQRPCIKLTDVRYAVLYTHANEDCETSKSVAGLFSGVSGGGASWHRGRVRPRNQSILLDIYNKGGVASRRFPEKSVSHWDASASKASCTPKASPIY